MSLSIASLNSGSNANCYYVANKNEAVLIDAGLSLRETEKRMAQLGLAMEKVKAIFISHEHSDHITGLPAISKKYQIPVYITEATYKNCNLPVEEHLLTDFEGATPIAIDGLTVTPFRKHHDAADPYSFIISSNGVNAG
jgi:phosphoribosyl 1,2-cyclic phosphodiesterase